MCNVAGKIKGGKKVLFDHTIYVIYYKGEHNCEVNNRDALLVKLRGFNSINMPFVTVKVVKTSAIEQELDMAELVTW